MFHSLKTLLERAVRSSGIQKQLEANETVTHARKALENVYGDSLAHEVRVEFVQRGVLFLTTSSSMAKQELRLKAPQFITALNQQFGEDRVRDVRVNVGPVDGSSLRVDSS